MEKYIFKNNAQLEAEHNKIKAIKKMKEDMKGKKLLTEATYTVTTIDDAIMTIQECMIMLAMKKRNPMILSDIIGSTITGGVDRATEIFTNDEVRKEKIANTLKKRIILTLRSALTF